MIENQKQVAMDNFIAELEQYLRDNGAPIRLLDNTAAIGKKLKEANTNVELNEISLEIQNLLTHLSKKYGVDSSDKSAEDNKQTIDVLDKIEASLVEFKKTLDVTKNNYYEQHIAIVSETEKDIREILNTQAHYDKIENQGTFSNYFAQIENKYNNRNAAIISECAKACCDIGESTVKKIYGLTSQLPAKDRELSRKDFYEVFEKNSISEKSQLINYAQNVAKSDQNIQKFSIKLRQRIDEAVAKIKKKKTRKLLIPLAALLLVIGVVVAFEVKLSIPTTEVNIPNVPSVEVSENSDTSNNVADDVSVSENSNFLEKEIDYVKDAGSELINQAGNQVNGIIDNASQSANSVIDNVEETTNSIISNAGNTVSQTAENVANRIIQVLMIAFVIVFLIGYLIYLIILNKRTKPMICEATAKALAPEVEQFFEDEVLWESLKSAYNSVGMRIIQVFDATCSQISSIPAVQEGVSVNQAVSGFSSLEKKWQEVKRIN